jgi:hypothetical protein
MVDALLARNGVRCAALLPCVGWHCRRGFRPRSRLTFFAGAKKVSQESTLNTRRRAVVPVDTGRCAPAGGAHGLAQQTLDRGQNTIAARRAPTRRTTCVKRSSKLFGTCRIAALATVKVLARTASKAMRDGPPAAECRHSGAQTSWPACHRNLIPAPVERLLRETVRTTGRSAATGVYGHHRTPRCIQGAFLAYFLCTSKESESAAGPKPPPAMPEHTRQTPREAHSNASQARQPTTS